MSSDDEQKSKTPTARPPAGDDDVHAVHRDSITVREARRLYFESNGFGANGGYDEPWVDFSLGPIPFPFPNTPARVRAVRYHDVHHVLTGYETDLVGEFEISAWEIGAGCKDFAAAWVLNLGGTAGGLFRAPKRTFAAFVRGRRHCTVYGEPLEHVLDETVGSARARWAPAGIDLTPTAGDAALFVAATAVGAVVGLTLFALAVPLVPFGLVAHRLRKRS